MVAGNGNTMNEVEASLGGRIAATQNVLATLPSTRSTSASLLGRPPLQPSPRRCVKGALIAGVILLAVDAIYRTAAGIGYLNREQCILYRAFPGIGVLIYEHILEIGLIAFVGIFAAMQWARWVHRHPRLFPSNPVTAALYAAVLPVCSCAAVPLVYSLRGKRDERTTLAFVLTAPLLSPNIVILSFALMGATYGTLRIAASFVLVLATVYGMPFALRLSERRPRRPSRSAPTDAAPAKDRVIAPAIEPVACPRTCAQGGEDIYLETWRVFRGLVPYLLVAGVLAIGLDLLGPENLMGAGRLANGWGSVVVVLAGVPLYLCHGTEVLLLRPLVHHGISLGTAVGFSLTSTAVCLASLAMLARFLGRRPTIVLTACLLLVTLALTFLIDQIPGL